MENKEGSNTEKMNAKLYLLVHNIQKPANVGTMIRSCSAFNVDKIFLISKDPDQKKQSKLFKKFGLKYGDKGTSDKMEYHFFFSIEEARTYFNEHKITICGIEIGDGAQSVNTDPWRGDTVLVPGNEGTGMPNFDILKLILIL
jgi:tRNA G18 (ribose-2'-O)-methylase SpoU